MTKHTNLEDRVECPVEGCNEEALARGLFIHVFQTDDPDEEGHWPRYETPPDLDLEEIKVAGKNEVEMDYPDTVELEDVHYLDTYTGEAYEGKRGLMIHLGQMEGRKNFPEDVTDHHEAEDFPIVEVDEDGRVTKSQHALTVEPETEIDLEKDRIEIQREIAESVSVDGHCELSEVTFQAMSDREKARVQCSEKGLTQRLLRQEAFEVKKIKTLEGRSRGVCTVDEAYELLDNSDVKIVGVTDRIPISTLKIKPSSRTDDCLRDIAPEL